MRNSAVEYRDLHNCVVDADDPLALCTDAPTRVDYLWISIWKSFTRTSVALWRSCVSRG